jgi:citrate synthase
MFSSVIRNKLEGKIAE